MMTWSLRLHNGDFATSASEFSVVTDENKLVQDLRCALLEPMGTDELHLEFGSLIDGGTMPDGTIVAGPIGLSDVNQAAAMIRNEITRIATLYQNQQLARAKVDRLVYNRVSLTPAEVLISLTDIAISQTGDSFLVNVILHTARGENINLVFPVASN